MTRSAAVRLLAILGLVALVYAPTAVAPFCSHDDFWEVHRAAFRDAPNPSLVFTTSHFGSAKYRPLNRAMTLVTFLSGGGRAVPYRVRNLVSHLACVALAFALSLALFRSPAAAGWGALLFGVHPLANMTIVGAINTNAVGHAFLLAALLLFLRALRATSTGPVLIAASLALAGLGILTYDAEVVYFPLTALLVVVELRASGRRPGRGLLAAWIGGGAILAGAYGLLRALYVPAGKVAGSVPSFETFVKSLATYLGVLLLPLDPVLLHDLLGTPYPFELASPGVTGRVLALALLGGAAVAVLVLGVRAARRMEPQARASAAPGAAFLGLGILVLLSPLLLFTRHASETYVYLPAAFVALLGGVLLDAAGRTAPRAATAAGIVLVALAAAGTVSRNVAVLRCGRAAERLVEGLRDRAGRAPALFVANAPGEERSHRYGLYGFRGTDTVGDRGLADGALSNALQLARREVGVVVTVLEPGDLKRAACAPPETRKPTMWVRADGAVSACVCDAMKDFR